MAEPSTAMRSRTLGEIVLAGTLVLLGIFILVNALIATAFSIAVIGVVAILGGIVRLLEAFLKHRGVHRISAAVSGLLLLVLGIMIVANPVAAAISLTIVLALVFFIRGVTSIAAGFVAPIGRIMLILGGLISVALAVIVLLNLGTMTALLLGVLLGVELIVAGVTIFATGRPRGLRV